MSIQGLLLIPAVDGGGAEESAAKGMGCCIHASAGPAPDCYHSLYASTAVCRRALCTDSCASAGFQRVLAHAAWKDIDSRIVHHKQVAG